MKVDETFKPKPSFISKEKMKEISKETDVVYIPPVGLNAWQSFKYRLNYLFSVYLEDDGFEEAKRYNEKK